MDINSWDIIEPSCAKDLPWEEGVYAFCLKEKVLYIGKSKCLGSRVGYGRHETLKLLQPFWKVIKIRYIKCSVMHERQLIKKYMPVFNTLLKK